jgi:enoyl-CoA hydratase/carnithine racemase
VKNDPGETEAPGDGPTGMPAWTGDFGGSRAEQYGYVNRVVADDELDGEVSRIASRLARFDHDAIARTKS